MFGDISSPLLLFTLLFIKMAIFERKGENETWSQGVRCVGGASDRCIIHVGIHIIAPSERPRNLFIIQIQIHNPYPR